MRAGGQQWIEGVDIDLVIELIGYLLDCKEPGLS
jgi:hypothetical protein